jgi:hypothetical protein
LQLLLDRNDGQDSKPIYNWIFVITSAILTQYS